MSLTARSGLAMLCGICLATTASAQVPDTAAVGDSLGRDTTDYSALFLRTQEEGRVTVPTLPRLGSPSLLPGLTRLVFDRDTIEWHNAETLSDLLTKVPGTYLWRGGWIGRPEWPSFQGRGAASVSYVLDGVPLIPLGRDSVVIDPSLLPLSFFERVEVERVPGELRVLLYTRRHSRLPPRTRVGVSSGDFDIARYQGSIEQRNRAGLGFVVAAEHLAVPLSSDQQGSFSNTQGWLQLSYLPPASRWAANLQVFRSGPSREHVFDPTEGSSDTLSIGLDGRRTDLQATVSFRERGDGLGARLAAALAYSSWREDSTEFSLPGPIGDHPHLRLADHSVTQLGIIAGYRTRTAALDANVWYRSRWTPLDLRMSASATPAARMAGAVEVAYQRHNGGRSSRWLLARGGLVLPGGIRATALWKLGSTVFAAALPGPAVTISDRAALLSFDRPRLALEVGYWRTAGATPPGFSLYPPVRDLGASPPTKWLTVSARVAPRQWFVLDGWYSDATGEGPDGQAPTHSVINATIQSKFLPTFRSGIFGLKLQGTIESWGTGVIGRSPAGDPVALPGATFVRGLIQLKIGDFVAYYDRANLQGARLAYVPGLPIIPFASTFGVRWEFSN